MAILHKYDFSHETTIKDSLFSKMCDAYELSAKENVAAESGHSPKNVSAKESVSFDEMSNEVLGSKRNRLTSTHSGISTVPSKEKINGGMRRG